jgi:hypothetical protein
LTYCAGFFDEDYIVIVADTVETQDKSSEEKLFPPGLTFFSEQTDFEGFEVSDTALKIFEFENSRLVGAAGD